MVELETTQEFQIALECLKIKEISESQQRRKNICIYIGATIHTRQEIQCEIFIGMFHIWKIKSSCFLKSFIYLAESIRI